MAFRVYSNVHAAVCQDVRTAGHCTFRRLMSTVTHDLLGNALVRPWSERKEAFGTAVLTQVRLPIQDCASLDDSHLNCIPACTGRAERSQRAHTQNVAA